MGIFLINCTRVSNGATDIERTRSGKKKKKNYINPDGFLLLIRIAKWIFFCTKQNWLSNLTSLPSLDPHHSLNTNIMPLSLWEHRFFFPQVLSFPMIHYFHTFWEVQYILYYFYCIRNLVGCWLYSEVVFRLAWSSNSDMLYQQV